jgi:hypothetical protein
MANRILNRRELRKQAEQTEPPVGVPSDAEPATVPAEKKPKKAPAGRKRSSAKKARPRMRARWGVFDSGMKQVAVFDYNQRAAAEEKLANLRATRKGTHFMQIVKEPMPEPAHAEAPVGG